VLIGKVIALRFLLTALMATVLSMAPPSGANCDVPVSVKALSNVKNIDGGYSFTLAATQ
jgi:hypothetical protein